MASRLAWGQRNTSGSIVHAAVLDDYQDGARKFGSWHELPESVHLSIFHDHVADLDALVQRLEDFEIVIAMRERTPFGRGLLQRLPRLRLLITTGPVNVSIDVAAAREMGITVCGTGGELQQTAELAWALILGLTRHVAEEDSAIRDGGWQVGVGEDLGGSTLGIVGLGRLGRMVARVGLAFGMRVIAWSENLDVAAASEIGVEPVGKEELFRISDIVSIHTRLSERTRGLVTAKELSLMKPTAFLINTARGPIVDEASLVEALKHEKIAGAGLEVFDIEPLPLDHPLRTLPRTLLTPHIGYVTKRTYQTFYRDIVADINAFLDGQPIRVIVP